MSSGGVFCYNKGCGEQFNPSENPEGSCAFHPGAPFFHDAYKGWSCCKKKCTDFTEFLNIKGCTKGCHNPVKPEEPKKYVPEKENKEEIIEYHAPKPVSLPRPSSDLPLKKIKPTISSILEQQIAAITINNTNRKDESSTPEIEIGTMCKNSGCKQTYDGVGKGNQCCQYHPGAPIFHEGMKYWTCCNKKTSDFTAFLEQAGCARGEHCWIKNTKTQGEAPCRLDWHQTGPWVVVSIFAKKYDPKNSFVKLSPVKLSIELVFPSECTVYCKDMQLFGVVDVDNSCVSMLPTKVEIKLRKGEALNWNILECPKSKLSSDETNQSNDSENSCENRNSGVESVDLGDL